MTKEFDIIKLSNVCEPKSANRIISWKGDEMVC